jgi:SpoVK/Ycf46/Vps4 family AAA+-type ATPase
VVEHLASLGNELPDKSAPPVILLRGRCGSGKRSAASYIAAKQGLGLLEVDSGALLRDSEAAEKIKLMAQESFLSNAALYFRDFDQISAEPEHQLLKDEVFREIRGHRGLIFLGGESRIEIKREAGRVMEVRFDIPSYSQRKECWEKLLGEGPLSSKDIDIGQIAQKFRLTYGQIGDAVSEALFRAGLREEGKGVPDMKLLAAACRSQIHHKLERLSQKVVSGYSWEDIVLPGDRLDQLREIAGDVKNSHLVYDRWKFGEKHSISRGLNILFFGQSGTGKTMAAGIIANQLDLELYKIDLSTVVSKYIGETEKNLGRIFKEAETSSAILFFDEADALFGKRSEVKDAHDRYANIEVGYLLQKMEEYDGIVILATNMKKNMDDAFIRRMSYMVEFPFPGEEQRRSIWKYAFTKQTPLDELVDFDFLARQFRVSGGNIRNIAVKSAFYAAGDGGVVNMPHIIRAVKREYQKIGMKCMESEFGEYYELVRN